MNTTASTPGYTVTAKLLHWLVASLVVVQFVLANLAERAEDADDLVSELALFANHRSVGITILALIIIRLLWRWRNPPPPLPETVPRWQLMASRVSHYSLYGILLVMPISGWLMSSAADVSVTWFGLVDLPDFVSPNHERHEFFEEIHELLATLLFVIASLHILAALKHGLFDKDGVLQRMLPVSGTTDGKT
jgi:cytochrome b561